MGYYYQDTTNPSLGDTGHVRLRSVEPVDQHVATGSSTYSLTFGYDRYCNMTCVTNGSTNGPCPQYTFTASSNRMTNSGLTYDVAGNLTADGAGTGSYTYSWNAEGRLTAVGRSTGFLQAATT